MEAYEISPIARSGFASLQRLRQSWTDFLILGEGSESRSKHLSRSINC